MLGFACICKSLGDNGKFRSTTIAHVSKLDEAERLKKLRSIAVDNLYNTLQILKWCNENYIHMYRLSSGIIPLATFYKSWKWYEDKDILRFCEEIKEFVKEHEMRISLHPDQFCIINSNRAEVVESSKEILDYHNRLSNLVGNETLVLHTGSTAGGKDAAKLRFIDSFTSLDSDIRSKLVLENDDKSFSISDVLSISKVTGIPVVLDLHHHRCYNNGESLEDLREDILSSWKGRRPKVHLSSGREHPTDRHHSDFIDLEDFKAAMHFTRKDFDIMLECKEKDMAVLDLRGKLKELSL